MTGEGWRLAWTLARRELNGRFRGLRLLLVCLFLGVGALAAIGSLSAAISTELSARGRVILGGDVEFATSQRGPDPDERAAMAALGRLSETVRMQATAVAGGASVPTALKGVDAAYPLVGRVTLADGRRVGAPGAGETWIAPALAERLGLGVGGTVRFGTATFRVGGIIADEPDRLSEGFTLGPVAILSMPGIARSGLVQPGSLYETKLRVALDAGDPQAAGERVTRAFPAGGWEVRTRDRAAPGAQRFVDRMGEFLVLVGLSALVIAGIGVGGGVSSYLAARRPGIATLKVLGATSTLIARVYLLQVLAVAGLGTLAGLAAGVAAVPLIGWLGEGVLPVRPGFAIHALPLATAAAYGMLVALAFALPPLIEAGAVPAAGLLRGVHDRRRVPLARLWPAGLAGAGVIGLALATASRPGLSAGFLAAVAGVLGLLALVGIGVRRGARALPRPRGVMARLAVAGLHRLGNRTTTLVVALGLGLTLFVLLAAIRTSLDANIARSVPARAPALFALDVPRDQAGEFAAVARSVEPRATVATVPLLRGTVTGWRDVNVVDLDRLPEGAWALRGERGLTYSAALPDGSAVVEGQWWPPGYAGPPLVSVDVQLARAIGLRIGDPVRYTLLGVEREARVASFREIRWDSLGFNFVLVFSPNALADAPHNLSATVDMPKGREGAVAAALTARFPSTSVVEVGAVLGQVRDVLSQMATAIAAAASVAILAGIAVLIGAIAAAREARTYDAVILKTLGATRGQILGAQAIEYLLLGTTLAVVALGLGSLGAWYVVTRIFGFVFLPDWGAVATTLAAGMAIVLGTGLAGAVPVLLARPASALRTL